MNHSLITVARLTTYATSNPARDDSHAARSLVLDDVLSGDQYHSGSSSPTSEEETAIDDVVLGAPLDEGPSTLHKILHSPTADPIITVACSPQQSHPRNEAGCTWDVENWSCAYDVVFMSFWSIYQNSSSGWRNKWMQQAPKWSSFLGAAFDSLLTTVRNPGVSQAMLSREFTSFREAFRDELSLINPTYFRRHGPVTASVCQVLLHIFDDSAGREPHLNQAVNCDHCGISTHARCSFSSLGSTEMLGGYFDEHENGPLPLQMAVTRFIQRASQESWRHRCPSCSGTLGVESLSIPELPWLWFELSDTVSPIIITPRLVFGLHHQRQVYTLQAVIYIGGNHFTARFFDQQATWWNYNDMREFGAPSVEHINDEADLLENDGRRAAFLLYCQAVSQD